MRQTRFPLRADCALVRRSPLLALGALCALASVLYTLINNLHYKNLWHMTMDGRNLLFSGFEYFPAVIALLFAVLAVRERSGPLRNKFAAGYTATGIYLSRLFVGAGFSCLVYLVGTGIGIAVGMPLLGGLSAEPLAATLPLQIVWLFAVILSLSSLFQMVAVLVPGRIAPLPATLFTAVGGMLVTTPVQNAVFRVDMAGEAGFRATATRFINDFLPFTQATQLNPIETPARFALFPLWWVVFTALTTGVGLLAVRQRNHT